MPEMTIAIMGMLSPITIQVKSTFSGHTASGRTTGCDILWIHGNVQIWPLTQLILLIWTPRRRPDQFQTSSTAELISKLTIITNLGYRVTTITVINSRPD